MLLQMALFRSFEEVSTKERNGTLAKEEGYVDENNLSESKTPMLWERGGIFARAGETGSDRGMSSLPTEL